MIAFLAGFVGGIAVDHLYGSTVTAKIAAAYAFIKSKL
jgi:hypothetical protein